jgi:hypothetical protein
MSEPRAKASRRPARFERLPDMAESDGARRAVFDIFKHELATAGLVCISGPQADEAFFKRILDLNREPQGERLIVPAARDTASTPGPHRQAPTSP